MQTKGAPDSKRSRSRSPVKAKKDSAVDKKAKPSRSRSRSRSKSPECGVDWSDEKAARSWWMAVGSKFTGAWKQFTPIQKLDDISLGDWRQRLRNHFRFCTDFGLSSSYAARFVVLTGISPMNEREWKKLGFDPKKPTQLVDHYKLAWSVCQDFDFIRGNDVVKNARRFLGIDDAGELIRGVTVSQSTCPRDQLATRPGRISGGTIINRVLHTHPDKDGFCRHPVSGTQYDRVEWLDGHGKKTGIIVRPDECKPYEDDQKTSSASSAATNESDAAPESPKNPLCICTEQSQGQCPVHNPEDHPSCDRCGAPPDEDCDCYPPVE